MVKRIFKIVGICMAVFLVIAGGSIGIFALTGGFVDKEIPITKIYFDNKEKDYTQIRKEEYSLTGTSFKVACEPANATNQKLIVTVSDVVGVLDNPPTTINVGEEVNLKIRKDNKGNNIGGPVYLEIRPEKGMGVVYYTLFADVAIPDNVLYFSGNATDKINSTGKSFTMAISDSKTPVYLRSDLTNAFYVQHNNENFKSATISYIYRDLDGNIIPNTGDIYTGMKASNVNSPDGSYYYKLDIIPKYAGTIDITAKMHRTYEIEKVYNEMKFNTLSTMTDESAQAALLVEYNKFLNDYISYFDNTEESYTFFSSHLNSEGKVQLSKDFVEKSKQFVFVECKATIEVTAVNLDKVTCGLDDITYNVFENNALYALEENSNNANVKNVINAFKLGVEVDSNADKYDETDEIARLINKLDLKSYLYIDAEKYENDKNASGDIKPIWAVDVQDDWLPVYDFVDGEPITIANDSESAIVGYLIPQGEYNKYLSVDIDHNIGCWKVNANVPMLENDNEESIEKALYIQFKVEGEKLVDGETVPYETSAYTRVYINYNSYTTPTGQQIKLKSSAVYDESVPGNPQLTGYENLKGKMTLNESLNNADDYAKSLQELNVDILNIADYDNKQYKKVLYFVESNSNNIESNSTSKLLSVGKYSFLDMDGAEISFGGELLIGERLPSTNNKNTYIRALNADEEEAKIFAVVCLTDKKGNPIDLYGRPIKIEELKVDGEEIVNTLYVVACSYSSTIAGNEMIDITVDNFVENINFYTKNAVTTNVGGVDFNEGEYVKRNWTTSYVDINGTSVTGQNLIDIQNFLDMKLLDGYNFKFDITNFEWASDGTILDKDTTKDYSFIGIDGKVVELSYKINVVNNKQIALNNMCENFNDNFYLSKESNITIVDEKGVVNREGEGDTGNAISITFTIRAKGTTNRNYLSISPSNSIDIPYYNLNSLTGFNRAYYVSNVPTLIRGYIADGKIDSNSNVLARYTQDGNATKEFVIQKPDNSYENHKLAEFEDGKILFKYVSNLHNEDGDENPYKFDIVDMSQYVSEGALAEEPTDEYSYASISEYLNKYFSGTLEITVPEKYARLDNDINFYNLNDDNYIYVGDKKYPISDNKIRVDSVDYSVETTDGKKVVKLSKDTYYPIYTDNEIDYLMILGAELQIYEDNGYYVSNTNIDTIEDPAVSISYINGFNMGDYINELNPCSASIKDNNLILTANFLKGETDGIRVYVMTTITCGDKNFRQVYYYNVEDKPVEITVYNDDNEDTGINSDSNRLEIDAGETSTIALGGTKSPRISYSPDYQSYLLKNIKFKVEGLDSPISVDVDEEESALKITADNLNESVKTKVTMYLGDSKTVLGYIYITVKPNYTFAIVDNNMKYDNGVYTIKYISGTNININENDFWKYFSIDKIKSMALKEGDDVVTSVLIPTSYYISNNGTSITSTLDAYKEYTINLVLSDGTVVTKTIRFESTPKYILDTSKLQGNVMLVNGENILDRIKIFNYDATNTTGFGDEITDLTKTDLFEVKGSEVKSDGKICATHSTTDTLISNLTIKAIGSDKNLTIGNVYIRGVEIYYSSNGEFATDHTYNNGDTKLEDHITITSNEKVVINKYLVAYYAGNPEDMDIVVVAIDSAGKIKELTESGKYTIAYAYHNGEKYVVVASTNYKLTVNIQTQSE